MEERASKSADGLTLTKPWGMFTSEFIPQSLLVLHHKDLACFGDKIENLLVHLH